MNWSVARIVIALVALNGCAGAGGTGGAPPRPGATLRSEDRVVIPTMVDVIGVAASDRMVFLATPEGLGVYDHRFSTWHPPLSRVDGWPGREIIGMMEDPADPEAVWFAGALGVFRYRVGDDRVMRAIVGEPLTGGIGVPMDDPASGLVVRTASGRMLRVSSSGTVLPYIGNSRLRTPQGLAQVYARYPALRNFERLLTQDGSLRSWPLRSAASLPTVSEVWFGSAGGGAFKVDPLFMRGEPRPFGLLSGGAGAITSAITGVWIGGSGFAATGRSGLTYVTHDLQQWKWADGAAGAPFPGGARVQALSVFGSFVWAATDRGLVRVDAQSGNVDRRWDNASGLGSAIALSVLATRDGAWVGTSTGLTFAPNEPARDAVVNPAFTGAAVRGLVRRGDTLWMATDIGVLALAPGETQPRKLRAADGDSRLALPIVAMASADSIVVVATSRGDVLRLNGTTGRSMDTISYLNTSRVGRINAIAIDARSVWVAGDVGVSVTERATHLERFVPVGLAIPGEALGVALSNDFAWIAAREGAVRLRRTANGTLW
ncbi:MAG TPA: hypothetical protein VJR92_01215 [Gemmatimonadaceae bacterium]|nr:hypothetical protein [Gemmatimonadaceae bacterium]